MTNQEDRIPAVHAQLCHPEMLCLGVKDYDFDKLELA
jgi:hypothetical protein